MLFKHRFLTVNSIWKRINSSQFPNKNEIEYSIDMGNCCEFQHNISVYFVAFSIILCVLKLSIKHQKFQLCCPNDISTETQSKKREKETTKTKTITMSSNSSRMMYGMTFVCYCCCCCCLNGLSSFAWTTKQLWASSVLLKTQTQTNTLLISLWIKFNNKIEDSTIS